MPRGSWWMKQKTHLFAQVVMSPGRGGSSDTPRSRPGFRSSVTVTPAPARSTATSSRASAAWKWKSIASRTGWPLIATIRSARRSPAAALRARTAATRTPSAELAEQRGFMRPIPLVGAHRVQEPHPLHDVLQAGDHGEPGGEPHHRAARERRELDVTRREPDEDREDLEEGRRLAGPRGARIETGADHLDDDGADHQDDVTADHHGGDPERQRFEIG